VSNANVHLSIFSPSPSVIGWPWVLNFLIGASFSLLLNTDFIFEALGAFREGNDLTCEKS
jgi:hypothetical protein